MPDREKLIELLMDKPFGNSTEEREIAHAEDVAEYLIANGVTVRERGQWINPYINRYGHPCHCCSVCGFKASYQDKNFCPNCGAKMDGERRTKDDHHRTE